LSLPLTTRFGADPLLDLELANKQYVDNSSGGGTDTIQWFAFMWNTSTLQLRLAFSPLNMGLVDQRNFNTTEAVSQFTIRYAFNLRRLAVLVPTNTDDANSTTDFRDDGVSVGDTLTVTSATTGLFETADFTQAVAIDSLCCYQTDFSGVGSGTIGFWVWSFLADRT